MVIGLLNYEVLTKCVNKESSKSVAVTTFRFKGCSLLLILNQSRLTRLGRPSLGKAYPLGIVSVLQYCVCFESGQLPILVRRKELVFLWKFLRVVVYFLQICFWHYFVQLPAWIFFLLMYLTRRRSLLIQKYFDNIGFEFIVFFSREKPLRWKKKHTHTQTHI